MWHQFDKVAPLIKYGLGAELPSFKPFKEAIQRRHDIVHRSGHDIQGAEINISEEDIRELAEKVLAFANEMDANIVRPRLRV